MKNYKDYSEILGVGLPKQVNDSINGYVERSKVQIPYYRMELQKLDKNDLIEMLVSMTCIVGCSSNMVHEEMGMGVLIAADIVGVENMRKCQDLLRKANDSGEATLKKDKENKILRN